MSRDREPRRGLLTNRLAASDLVRKVIGPKVVEPVAEWYRDNVVAPDESARADRPAEPDTPGEPDRPAEPQRSSTPDEPGNGADRDGGVGDHLDGGTRTRSSLDAARAAEAFLAGVTPSDAAPPVDASRMEATTRPSDHPTPAAALDTTDRDPPEGPTAGGEPDLTDPAGATSEDPVVPGRLGRARRVAAAVTDRVRAHNLNVVAAGIAFWALLAIPAVLTAVVSIYGLVADPGDVESQIADALADASPEMQQVVSEQMAAVAGASTGGLAVGAVVGILAALWTASGAVAKVIATLNTIWGCTEDRGFLKLRGLALGLTVGAVLLVSTTAFALAALPAVLGSTEIGELARWLLNIGRFPVMLALMAVALSALYWAAPNRRRPYRFISVGAAAATVLWLVLSGLFSIYTASFAGYNETYGGLGAAVVLLLWLFITAFMVLLGAEIDAERETWPAAAAP